MMFQHKVHGLAGLALIAAVAGVGCGGGTKGGGTGGGTGSTTGTTSTGSTSAGHPSTTAATTSGDTSGAGTTGSSSASTSGGTGPGDCTTYRLQQCKTMKMCAPHLYMQAYEGDDTLCQSEATRLCATLPSSLDATTPGVADAAACQTAIAGSCAAYLAAMDRPPAACQPKPGTKMVDQSCLVSAQCGAGLSCYTGGPPGCTQYCGPVGTVGKPCAIVNANVPQDDLCDPANGLHCVQGAIAASLTDNAYQCRKVGYVALGAPCFAHSDEQCDSGLACSTMAGPTKGTCVALLQEGATCVTGSTDKDPCDGRLGLSCQPTDPAHPAMGSTCQAAYVVPDNATCGMVMDGTVTHNHVCGDYSYCDGTGVCKRKAMQGEGCVANGCYPPYACSVGMCQAPTVQVDPPCTAVPTVPANQLACGPTPGGLPLACASACCMSANPATPNACAATGACGTSAVANAELDCEDSSQCAAGSLCCLKFNPKSATLPPVMGTCTASASCNFEICRTDGAAPCAGGTCVAAAKVMSSDWTVFLPDEVGFCKAPTCVAPNDAVGCAAAKECCSGQCDLGATQHQNLCF